MAMNVSELMASVPSSELASADSVAIPAPGEDVEESEDQETMKLLVEEFRSAPSEEAADALEQMVRMIVRKVT